MSAASSISLSGSSSQAVYQRAAADRWGLATHQRGVVLACSHVSESIGCLTDAQTISRRQGRQSERRASNSFTTFLTSTPHLERFFQASKRQVPSFSVN